MSESFVKAWSGISRGVLVVLFCNVFCASAGASTVRIQVLDRGTGELSKVLVITRSLEADRKEVSRDLTGTDGFLPPIDVPPGIYESIATFPYGRIMTQVKDFEVTSDSEVVEIHLNYKLDQTINLNAISWHVHVRDQQGHPVPDAWVIGRNGEASTGTTLAKTDRDGDATVSLPCDGALITVLYRGKVWSEPAYQEGDVAHCQSHCIIQAKDRLEKSGAHSIVSVPASVAR